MRYDLGGKTMTLIAGRRNIGGGFGLMPLNIAAHVKANLPPRYFLSDSSSVRAISAASEI
jgi:hypothetical protein